MWLIFLDTPTSIQTIMIHVDQLILSEPSINFFWIYQDMMEWMSRILVGEMAGADDYFCVEVGKMWLIFLDIPTLPIQTIMIHVDQMILSEPSIIFIWTYQDMIEWMSRILVGEMAMVPIMIMWREVGQMLLIFLDITTPIQTIMIHVDQMILSEPSIIFIWTYQDMMEWMSRILVGEMADPDHD
jgi:hypothetical protein